MTGSFKYRILFICTLLIAAVLRFVSLEIRPMHTDEAVHGIKFGELLETGVYKYDKSDYHGPTLNYFTFVPALIRSQNKLVKLDEFTLRSVTAFFGLAIIMLILIIKSTLKWKEILALAILIAISPMLVFYSRYYIQEVLLVFFNIGLILSAFNYIISRKLEWIISAGLFAGLMMATKETWILFLGTQIVALLIVLLKKEKPSALLNEIGSFFKSVHFLSFTIIVLLIYIVFFSSFFTNWNGIAESLKAFAGYFDRAGTQDLHQQPWWYYFKILAKGSSTKFLIRADIWFLIGGIAGFALSLKSKQTDSRNLFYLFFGYSTLLLGIILSMLPYKTPWNFLMVYAGLIFMTNYVVIHLLKSKSKKIWYVVFSVVIIHFGYQTYSDNLINYSEPENTFVYSHPTEEFLEINNKVHTIFESITDEMQCSIDIIVPRNEYWPLPWYFRDLKNIGWYSEVDFESPAAPVIVTTLPNSDLSKKLFELPPPGQRYLYIPMFETDKALRPGVNANVLLRKDYWDMYKKNNPVKEN